MGVRVRRLVGVRRCLGMRRVHTILSILRLRRRRGLMPGGIYVLVVRRLSLVLVIRVELVLLDWGRVLYLLLRRRVVKRPHMPHMHGPADSVQMKLTRSRRALFRRVVRLGVRECDSRRDGCWGRVGGCHCW